MRLLKLHRGRIMDKLLIDECEKAYGEWCKQQHLVDTTFTSWAIPGRPSYAWLAWQTAWDYRNKQSEPKQKCGCPIDRNYSHCSDHNVLKSAET